MTINSWIESYGDDIFGNYDLSELKRDECFITVNNTAFPEVYLYEKYEECIGCPFTYKAGPILQNTEFTTTLNTRFTKWLRIVDKNDSESLIPNHNSYYNIFNEFGIYKFTVEDHSYEILKEPVSIYFPILTVFLIYGIIFSLIPISQFIWKKLKSDKNLVLDSNPPQKKERVKSLDTFRGISIVVMIFVNYGHGGYPWLEHAPWNGLYVGDLVFPWFLWIMGVCIPISTTSALRKNMPRMKIFKNIFKRSCKLFAIGLFLGGNPYFDTMRIPGVLQRFAVGYFVVASLCAFTMNKEADEFKNLKHIQDILNLKFSWVIVIFIVILHACLTFLLDIPGCPRGYLGPGGNHDGGQYRDCTGGSAGYIDEVILGKHLYQGAEIRTIYKSKPFDPEGILGSLTTIFQVFLGVQAGMTLVVYKSHKMRLIRWLVWAVICGLLGGGLCNFSKEDGWIPLNKNLWSLSFVLVTSCFAFILLSVCYFIIDMMKVWTGKPFLFAGMNSIFMYIGHNMTYSNFPIHWYTSGGNVNPTHFMTLIENIWATSFWVVVSYYLYKIEYFLTL